MPDIILGIKFNDAMQQYQINFPKKIPVVYGQAGEENTGCEYL